MKEQTIDRRKVRTKRMIRDAFTELIKEKGFDEMTVKDITMKADINRGTFYLHYRDKYDLLEQSEEEIIEGLRHMEQGKPLKREDVVTNRVIDQPSPFITNLYEYLSEHAEFIKVLLGPKGDPAFPLKLKEVMRNNMEKTISSYLDEERLTVPLHYLTAYSISAHLGVIQQWLDEGMKETPQEMAIIVARMIFGNPYTIVKR
ncbi:TetR/AcrR family transcriptional regulator [Brevibacillus daliensis]|uniref:TetR/AcrR family transcriptional regulator n=1 Tax=Brevibacillus daliensis TaxID=2892995 RepID=UPI001E37DC9A|nr:TetR/AcrR family transcriptional regulator [Brevibacillus daliensis]